MIVLFRLGCFRSSVVCLGVFWCGRWCVLLSPSVRAWLAGGRGSVWGLCLSKLLFKTLVIKVRNLNFVDELCR